MPDKPTPLPDYEQLCDQVGRARGIDPEAIAALAAVRALGLRATSAIDAGLAHDDMTEGRLRVLSMLLDVEAAKPSELAQQSGVTKGTITGLVDGLEADGLVRRVASKADKRSTLVSLTAAGRKRVSAMLPDHLQRLSAMMAELTKWERKALIRLLRKVDDGIASLADSA